MIDGAGKADQGTHGGFGELGRTVRGGGRRPVRVGQVDRVAAAGAGARRALPRHRRDVPGGDLGRARGRRRPARRRRPSPKIASARSRSTSGTDPVGPHISVDGRPVDVEIRGPEVTAGGLGGRRGAGRYAQLLVARQREIIAAGRAGIVVEGRDIGDGRRARRRPQGLPDRVRGGAGPPAQRGAGRPTSHADRGRPGPARPARLDPGAPTRCARRTTRSCSTPPGSASTRSSPAWSSCCRSGGLMSRRRRRPLAADCRDRVDADYSAEFDDSTRSDSDFEAATSS